MHARHQRYRRTADSAQQRRALSEQTQTTPTTRELPLSPRLHVHAYVVWNMRITRTYPTKKNARLPYVSVVRQYVYGASLIAFTSTGVPRISFFGGINLTKF